MGYFGIPVAKLSRRNLTLFGTTMRALVGRITKERLLRRGLRVLVNGAGNMRPGRLLMARPIGSKRSNRAVSMTMAFGNVTPVWSERRIVL